MFVNHFNVPFIVIPPSILLFQLSGLSCYPEDDLLSSFISGVLHFVFSHKVSRDGSMELWCWLLLNVSQACLKKPKSEIKTKKQNKILTTLTVLKDFGVFSCFNFCIFFHIIQHYSLLKDGFRLSS